MMISPGLGSIRERQFSASQTIFAWYESGLKRLREMQLVYPCFATRKEIQDAIEASGIGLAG